MWHMRGQNGLLLRNAIARFLNLAKMDASARENAIRKEKKSSRRSSILKRRPLGNVNMNEELKDRASLLPSKRRVSFALCNEMREICEDTTDLSAHVKIPAVPLPEDNQALSGASAQQDLAVFQADGVSSQTSTPVGAKRPKRMSLAFSRLSIIPPDGGEPSQGDDSGSVLLFDTEGLGECEDQCPPSVRQSGTNARSSDSLYRDEVSMELTCTAPPGEPLRPVSNECDHSMDVDDFVAYEDYSNELPQNVPRRLEATAVGLGNHSPGQKYPTDGGSSVLTSHSTTSSGLHDLVQKRESLAVADMSLDLSCTSSPRQPCIHPDLVGEIGRDRNPNNREHSHPDKDRKPEEDGRILQTDSFNGTSQAVLPDPSSMSLTCQTPMQGRDGVPKADGPEDGHILQIDTSNGTSHAVLPDTSSISLICQTPMQGRDGVPLADGSDRPMHAFNGTSDIHPPNSSSMSLTCENPVHIGDGAQERRHSTVFESVQPNKCAVVGNPMDQLPAAMDSSVTERTCKIPAIQPLMPQDSSRCGNTSSNASLVSQSSHTMTVNDPPPAKDTDADVKRGESRVLCQSPAGDQTKAQHVTVTTLRPPALSTSMTEPPSRPQLSNSLPLSTSVAISSTHGLPKIGLTRQSKRTRPSARALKKRISVPRSITTSKVSALAQVHYSASMLHSSAASLPCANSAVAPSVRKDVASEAGNPEHNTEAVGSGEEAAVTGTGNRPSNPLEMTCQGQKDDRIEHPQEVTPDVGECISEENSSHVAAAGHGRVTGDDSDQKNHTSVREDQHTSVREDQHTSMQEDQHTSVREDQHTSVREDQHTSMQEDQHTSVREDQHTSVRREQHTSVREDQHTSVREDQHTSVREDQHTSVREDQHTSVREDQHTSVRGDQHISVQEEEHMLTQQVAAPDGGTPWQKNDSSPSFSKTDTLSTSPSCCPSSADSRSVSVTTMTDVASSTNGSVALIADKPDDEKSMCSATAPHDATRELSRRRHLNRTYSISPDSSFICGKGDGSWTEEEAFSSPMPEEASSLVAGTVAPLPCGGTPLHPSPCPSDGNWMQGKDVDISLVDNSIVSLPANQAQTPQVQLRTTVGGHEEEEWSKNPVATPDCTPLTGAGPPSGTDVCVQGVTVTRPTEDMDTTHRHYANPDDVSNCSITGGTLNTTLQPAGYDSPLLHVFKTPGGGTPGTLLKSKTPGGGTPGTLLKSKTPGGGTPGTLLKSKISFVTTPWSVQSPFTPVIPNPNTPSITAESSLWKDLPVVMTMENAPEFFNVDRAEIKALDQAETLKRLAAGHQEQYTVLQSEDGLSLDPSTIDARLLQAGLNYAMEGIGHLYTLMKYQERYCGKLFPWSLEDQVTSVYDPIEVLFEAGDRLHWIAKKRVEMELLASHAKTLMRGPTKSYRWLIHSWTKDVIKILFFQPMVAVAVNVCPVCELGSHMIDADISLNVVDSRIQDKDVFILDKYSMQGSLPKVAAEVLLKIAALCQEWQPKLP